jgi:hypothetical protein
MSIDFSKRPKGMSKREYWSSITGRPKEEYKSSSDYKMSDDYWDKQLEEMTKAILKATPKEKDPLPSFDEKYTEDLEAEDFAQAEALYTPYFEQQIANELEDLNAYTEVESVNYERSLRSARISMASGGGAIGSEREREESEITQDYDARRKSRVRQTERTVGTEKLTNAGFESAGQQQEGSLVGNLKEAIQEGQLWYKNQRAQRYYGNAETYYSQPSSYSLAGNKF